MLDLEKRDGEGEDGFQALAPGMGPASMSACRHLHSMSAGKYLNSMLRVQHAVSSPSHGLLRDPSSFSAGPLRKVPQIRAPRGPRYPRPTRTLGGALRDPLRDPCLDKLRKCSTRGSLEARNQRGKSRRRRRISASQKASANARRAIFPRGSAWASQVRHQFL